MKKPEFNTANTSDFIREVSVFLRNWHVDGNKLQADMGEKVYKRIHKIASTMQMVKSGKIQAEDVGMTGWNDDTLKDTAEYTLALSRSIKKLKDSKLPDLSDIDLVQSLAFFNGREENRKSLEAYLEYPKAVHLETQAICNAKCSFCPYEDLSRKGERMSMDDIYKIIQDLQSIPSSHAWHISPYKVNEPFLDERLDAILAIIYLRLNCSIHIISNGNHMPDSILNHLINLDNKMPGRLKMSISLNTTDPSAYKKLMKMSLNKTLRNLDKLHKLAEHNQSSKFLNSIFLSAVSTDSLQSKQFNEFAKDRYPKFHISNLHMNDWIGHKESYKSHALADRAILSSPCLRWADLSITATGEIALCCMDASASHELGNAINTNVLDLYRNKVRKLQSKEGFIDKRLNAPNTLPCSGCNYFQAGTFSYANLYGTMINIKKINGHNDN